MTKKRKNKIYERKQLKRFINKIINEKKEGTSSVIPKGILEDIIKENSRDYKNFKGELI